MARRRLWQRIIQKVVAINRFVKAGQVLELREILKYYDDPDDPDDCDGLDEEEQSIGSLGDFESGR